MGFTAVTIVAPNVPEGVDPLTFFTEKPRNKAQELAQLQAQAPGFTRLSDFETEDSNAPPNHAGNEAQSSTQAFAEGRRQSLTMEEKYAAQEAKTCVIPQAAEAPTKGAAGQNVDYAYLFPHLKPRTMPLLLGSHVMLSASAPSTRSTSCYASTPAPVLHPTEQEFMEQSPYDYIQKAASQYRDFGIVKIVPPTSYHREWVPFGQDISGFKCEKQVFMSTHDAQTFDAQLVRKGFFRAVLRFHATAPIGKGKRRLQKLPMFERRPVDLYRLFRSVRARGGLDAVVKRKEWAQVGRELGYASQALPTLSSTLRQAYLRALQPFEQFLEENGVQLSPHVILRLDVEDDDKPAKPRAGVRVLPNGIIVDAQGTDVLQQDREIITLDESRNQGPSYTPKSFRQKDTILPLTDLASTAAEKEEQYWHLPAFFETEKLSEHPGVRLLPFSKALTATAPHAYDLHGRYKPWKLSSLPFHIDALARYVQEDIDEFVIPQLHIGQQFSTDTWSCSEMAAYKISSLVDGCPRTWYTKNRVFADQQAGEIILIFPGVENMNWCHGYSATEDVSLFPGFDWLKAAMDPAIMNSSMKFCVQRLVYEATRSALNPSLRPQIFDAVEIFKQREHQIIAKIGSKLERARPDPTFAKSITCAITGAKRFWSWVLVNGETWSAEAYLDSTSVTADHKPVFVTRYTDVDEYFDNMVAAVTEQSARIQAWRQSAAAALSASPSMPLDTTLSQLCEQAPDSIEDGKVSAHLSSTIRLMQKWLDTYKDDHQKHTIEEARRAFNASIGCVDEQHNVEAARTRIAAEMEKLEVLWKSFITTLGSGHEPGVELRSGLEQLVGEYPELMHFVQNSQWSAKWAKNAVQKMNEVPVNCGDLLMLKEQGTKLGILASTEIMKAIDVKLNWGLQKSMELERLMLDRRAFDSALIRQYQDIDMRALQSSTRDRFLTLLTNLHLLDRMADPDLLKRPRRQEVELLNTFPAFSYIVSELNLWLSNAQSLDWLLIIGQLQKLVAQSPEPYTGPRIATSQLFAVRKQMYELKIVPDDIMLVHKTIEDASATLESAAPERRALYGFDP